MWRYRASFVPGASRHALPRAEPANGTTADTIQPLTPPRPPFIAPPALLLLGAAVAAAQAATWWQPKSGLTFDYMLATGFDPAKNTIPGVQVGGAEVVSWHRGSSLLRTVSRQQLRHCTSQPHVKCLCNMAAGLH